MANFSRFYIAIAAFFWCLTANAVYIEVPLQNGTKTLVFSEVLGASIVDTAPQPWMVRGSGAATLEKTKIAFSYGGKLFKTSFKSVKSLGKGSLQAVVLQYVLESLLYSETMDHLLCEATAAKANKENKTKSFSCDSKGKLLFSQSVPDPLLDVGKFKPGNFWIYRTNDRRYQSPTKACRIESPQYPSAVVVGKDFACFDLSESKPFCPDNPLSNCGGDKYNQPANGGYFYGKQECETGVYDKNKGYCVITVEPQPKQKATKEDLKGLTFSDDEIKQYLPKVTPYIKKPDDVVITEQPEPLTETTTVTNPDGTTTETKVQIIPKITITDPKSSPELSVEQKTTTTKYKDGVKQGESSTSTETKKFSPSTKPDADTKTKPQMGGDIPTDCKFFPTACAFFDWFKKDDVPSEPQLPLVSDLANPVQEYKLNLGAAVCPAPQTVNLAFVNKEVTFDYSQFCTFLKYLRLALIAFAYLYSVKIYLRM